MKNGKKVISTGGQTGLDFLHICRYINWIADKIAEND